MARSFCKSVLNTTVCFCCVVSSAYSLADGFGIFEPEALALGGASVAIASPGNAVFYNPAILAQQDVDEDSGRHGRFYIPALTFQASQSAQDLVEIDDDALSDRLTSSVDQFNTTRTAADAAQVVSASRELQSHLLDVKDEALYGDSFVGLVIAEPGPKQGGAFYVGGRVFGDGDLSSIEQQDLDLLEDYIEGLDFVASSGQSGAAHPEIFDGNGDLIDPRNDLLSSANAAGAVATEIGVGMAKQFEFSGQAIAFGVTPKLLLVKTYDAILNVAENRVDTGGDIEWQRRVNADIGVASKIGNFNIGLAVKDLFSENFTTPLGQQLSIDPKPRLGVGYLGQRFKVGVDYDITPIKPFANGAETQDLAVGVEWQVERHIAMRFGYREDLQGTRGVALSAGIGVNWGRFLMDFSYVEGDDVIAAALQFGLKI